MTAFLEQANAAMAAMVKEKTDTCLGKVLYEASMAMKMASPAAMPKPYRKNRKLLPAWIGRSFSIKDHIMEASFSFRIFKGIRLNRRVAATVAARRIPMTGEKEKVAAKGPSLTQGRGLREYRPRFLKGCLQRCRKGRERRFAKGKCGKCLFP